MARNGFFISDELCIKTCGSNRKDTYELFRKYVLGFNMSYEKYYEGRNQVNIDYPLISRTCSIAGYSSSKSVLLHPRMIISNSVSASLSTN